MKKFGCIFDLDGVLVNTAHYHFKSWERLAREIGFQLNPKIEENLRGISRMHSLDLVLADGNITCSSEDKIKYAALKNQWYLDSLKEAGHEIILPGTIDLLNALKEANISVAIGSASKNVHTVLAVTKLSSYFKIIVDGNEVAKSKPEPEVFINACRELQLREDQCIVFEDSPKGVDAALRGGFRVIGIGNSEVLSKAECCFDSLAEVSFSFLVDFMTN